MARTAHMTLHLAHRFNRLETAQGKWLLDALMPSKTANKILGGTMDWATNNTRLPVWHHLPAPVSIGTKGLIYLCANAIWSVCASAFVIDRNNGAEVGGTSVALLPPDLKGRGPTSPYSKVTKHQRACSKHKATPSAQLTATRLCPDTHRANPPLKQSAGFSQLCQSYCGSLFDGTQQ